MKLVKNVVLKVKSYCLFIMGLLLSSSVFADGAGKDLLSDALGGSVKATFDSSGVFWKVFILVDVILATAMAVKTKNPMVFLGVAAVAFIPAFLIKALVF